MTGEDVISRRCNFCFRRIWGRWSLDFGTGLCRPAVLKSSGEHHSRNDDCAARNRNPKSFAIPIQTDPAHGFLHVREKAPQSEEVYLDRVDMAVPHGTGAATTQS